MMVMGITMLNIYFHNIQITVFHLLFEYKITPKNITLDIRTYIIM